MSTRIRLIDGSDVRVLLSGKRVIEELEKTRGPFARFKSARGHPVWVNPAHIACIEEQAERTTRFAAPPARDGDALGNGVEREAFGRL